MADFIQWNKKYQEIPEQDRPQEGDVFICLTSTSGDPFTNWDYSVGRVKDGRAKPLALFQDLRWANVFATAI